MARISRLCGQRSLHLFALLSLVAHVLIAGASTSNNKFDVVWNSPWPSDCSPDAVNPRPNFEQYSVRTNEPNTTFNGNVIHTIYCGNGPADFFNTFPV
jgi:hypothetical protein